MRGGRKLGDLFERLYFDTQGDTWHSQCIRSAAYDDISMDVRGLAFTLAENEGSNGSNATDTVVPGHSIAFSSYPGNLFSTDDWYTLSSGLVRFLVFLSPTQMVKF